MHSTIKNRLPSYLSVGLVGCAAIASLCLSPTVAHAEIDRATQLDEPRLYSFEIEPHFSFGAENVYGSTGYGAGLRLSVPFLTGQLGRVPDNLAITFGGDVLHYDNCYFATNCGANYLLLPVAVQWNILVARQFSIFGEGGAYVYKGWVTSCGPADGPGCTTPSDFGVLPTFAIGGRLHLGDNVALTLRLGYPTMTLGVAFL